MIKVMVGNNLTRDEVVIDESSTLRSVLENNNIDYTTGQMHLDGAALRPGDLDKTFADFNISEYCFLLNVAKADNGTIL